LLPFLVLLGVVLAVAAIDVPLGSAAAAGGSLLAPHRRARSEFVEIVSVQYLDAVPGRHAVTLRPNTRIGYRRRLGPSRGRHDERAQDPTRDLLTNPIAIFHVHPLSVTSCHHKPNSKTAIRSSEPGLVGAPDFRTLKSPQS